MYTPLCFPYVKYAYIYSAYNNCVLFGILNEGDTVLTKSIISSAGCRDSVGVQRLGHAGYSTVRGGQCLREICQGIGPDDLQSPW